MHEIGIMEEILNLAIENTKEKKASHIKQINVTIGKMSGVVPSALEFAFEVIKKNTIAENATLNIELLPIICYCDSCQEKFMPEEWFFQCPKCQQFSNKIIQGKEIQLTSLEIS